MTNAEKFEEVFGIKPDVESMTIDCPPTMTRDCKYFENNGCHCEAWWQEEYKGKTDYGKKIQKG